MAEYILRKDINECEKQYYPCKNYPICKDTITPCYENVRTRKCSKYDMFCKHIISGNGGMKIEATILDE